MSTEQSPVAAGVDGAQYVQLFQRAHQKIVTLDRLEEQVAQLLSKREELQEELKELQSQINEELEVRIRSGIESPAKALSAIAGSVTGRNGVERFASQSLTGLAAQ